MPMHIWRMPPSFVGRDVRDVTDPGFIRRGRLKFLIEQVLRDRQALIRVRCDLEQPKAVTKAQGREHLAGIRAMLNKS